jgi:3D (Asp-Asp-Asp) domain-containing protein
MPLAWTGIRGVGYPGRMCHLYRRIGHGVILSAIAGAALFSRCTSPPPALAACQSMHLTGYLETGYPTADGTSTRGNAWTLAAAHYSVPFDTIATVEGVGVFRVADRGQLGPLDLDILVSTAEEAYALTGEYRVCLA